MDFVTKLRELIAIQQERVSRMLRLDGINSDGQRMAMNEFIHDWPDLCLPELLAVVELIGEYRETHIRLGETAIADRYKYAEVLKEFEAVEAKLDNALAQLNKEGG